LGNLPNQRRKIMKKYWRFLSLATILVIVLATLISTGAASAQTVCSPATAISVPFSKDGIGKFCYVTTTLCDYINSWHMTTLSINGIEYKQRFVYSSSIAPLNGVYTITYDGGTIPYAAGHFEIGGPCSGATNTPLPGVTNTPTRTRTPAITNTRTRTPTRTNTPFGPTRTRTRTPTRTNTPGITNTPTPTLPASICSPAETITAPFVFDRFQGDNTIGTHCWRISGVLTSINSFNVTNLSVNGVNLTNMWVAGANLPPQIGGYWYISYTAQTIHSHFDAQP
jgi:hypothetical protein